MSENLFPARTEADRRDDRAREAHRAAEVQARRVARERIARAARARARSQPPAARESERAPRAPGPKPGKPVGRVHPRERTPKHAANWDALLAAGEVTIVGRAADIVAMYDRARKHGRRVASHRIGPNTWRVILDAKK